MAAYDLRSRRRYGIQHLFPGNGPLITAAPVLCNGPDAEISEKFCERGGLVVGVDAARVGQNPSVAAPEEGVLEADTGVFDAGDDAVGADADEGDDGRAPAFDFGFETLAAGAKFVVGEFIGAGGGAFDDVGDPKFEVEKEGSFKGGEEARGEAAAIKGRPEAVAGAAEVAADGGGVESRVDAGEEDNEVFGCEIRDALVVRGEELGFGRFPGSGQCPTHRAASLEASSVGSIPIRSLEYLDPVTPTPFKVHDEAQVTNQHDGWQDSHGRECIFLRCCIDC